MTDKKVIQLIREAFEKNLTELDLSCKQLTQLPPKIKELKNLKVLNLAGNQLTQLPPEIKELKNLTKFDLSGNQLTQLPPEIKELKNLKELYLNENRFNRLPPDIKELKNLKELYLNENKFTQLPSEIKELKNLKKLNLLKNNLSQLSPEIKELKNLTTLYLSWNSLSQLPPEIKELKNLTTLYLTGNNLIKISQEIGELKNLSDINLSYNQLKQLPPEIGKLENLKSLGLAGNQLIIIPAEIGKLENLKSLDLAGNQLTKLPSEIGELKNLKSLVISGNPLTSPPPEIVSRGLQAIQTYLKQSKTTENNEAKLILVGNGEVGKTCLAYRLINNAFLKDAEMTEGINISKWKIPAPDSESSKIKLNIWDFGGQEIYHATHQFFLTTRSVYLLVWNARKTKDYDNIYYWLHTIEAFGGDSPIVLVMSKMNESDDDLNLRDLRSKFPQIKDYRKIDSKDGTGISLLKEIIRETAWNLPLMRVPWVDSWYRVREMLEGLGKNWINYEDYYEICISEKLDDENIKTLDGYLHDLGVTLHFKDRIGLKNIVILKPEWATNAFYKILSTKSVFHREGVLLLSELGQIWDNKTYPTSIHPQLMELMNKFELSYELPDKKSFLIPELLPKNAPDDFIWDTKDDLCFYYRYDSFLPLGIITRFIVRVHQDLEKKDDCMPLCWREGAVLQIKNSRALVEIKPEERQIEIRIKGDKKRETLGVICYHLDHINASIKKIKVNKQIPCNCSENCPGRYSYEKLLTAELSNVKTIQCLESFEHIAVSLLLDGYMRRKERLEESERTIGLFEYDVFICYSSKDKPIIEALIKDLKKEQVAYWVDEEQIGYGDKVIQKIEEGLLKSRYVIPCLSKNLTISGWTRAEYSAILNEECNGNSKRTVIPLKLDNCEISDIPLLLRDKRRVTYSNKAEFNDFIDFLKN